MRMIIKILLIILFFSALGIISAQERDINKNIATLNSILNRTETLIELLPNLPQNDLKRLLENRIHEARVKFEQAVEYFHNGQIGPAKLAIGQVFGILRQIEAIIKQHPALKIKFQEQLDRKIQLAEEIVRGSDNREALFMLNRAKFFRRKAYDLFRRGKTYAAIEHYRLAIYFTDQVQNLGSNNRDAFRDVDWHKIYLDTEILLERAKTLLETSDHPAQMNNMLQRAEREMRKVRLLYERKEYLQAQQKLLSINRVLYRIIDNAENIPQDNLQQLRMDFEALQFSLQSIREKLSATDNPAAQKIFQRAETLARKIQLNIDQKHPRLARRNIFLANRLVLRLYQMIENRPQSDPQALEAQINRTRNDLNQLMADRTKSETGNQMIELMGTNLQNAETAFARQDYLKASYYLTICNRLLLRYDQLQTQQSKKQFQEAEIEKKLNHLAALLERMKDQNGDGEFQVRYQNAKELYEIAQNAYQNQDLYQSKVLIQMAINLLTKSR